MSYERVLEALDEHGLEWGGIDRILVDEDTYDDFMERSNKPASSWKTDDAPAIRVTTGEQKIVYVDRNGYVQEIPL